MATESKRTVICEVEELDRSRKGAFPAEGRAAREKANGDMRSPPAREFEAVSCSRWRGLRCQNLDIRGDHLWIVIDLRCLSPRNTCSGQWLKSCRHRLGLKLGVSKLNTTALP